MTEPATPAGLIAATMILLREKLGVRGATLAAALHRARHSLPRHVYRRGLILAEAEPLADHPKLSLTLDAPALAAAAQDVRAHLDSIDLADRRKGWWLGMLGGLSFNLILFVALLIGVLVWRGFL